MKLTKYELVALGLTVMLLCFAIGYFAGGGAQKEYSLSLRDGAGATPTVSAFLPTTAASPTVYEEEKGESASPSAAPTGSALPTRNPASPTPHPTKAGLTATRVPTVPGLININTASQSELESLPGIGEVLAKRIIDYRTQHGTFKSISDITNVSGIGTAKFEAIKELITVG